MREYLRVLETEIDIEKLNYIWFTWRELVWISNWETSNILYFKRKKL